MGVVLGPPPAATPPAAASSTGGLSGKRMLLSLSPLSVALERDLRLRLCCPYPLPFPSIISPNASLTTTGASSLALASAMRLIVTPPACTCCTGLSSYVVMRWPFTAITQAGTLNDLLPTFCRNNRSQKARAWMRHASISNLNLGLLSYSLAKYPSGKPSVIRYDSISLS